MTSSAKGGSHAPKNHHHVPRFLLAEWAGVDGKLTVYSRKAGGIAISRRSPKNTAFEPNLYSLQSLAEGDQQWVETEIMSKVIDGPAAAVHARLLKGELAELDSDERSIWARFLMAQWWRSPDWIARMRRDSRASLLKALKDKPEEYEAARGDAKEGTLVEWVDNHAPNLHEFVALARVLPKLINDEKAGHIIINMRWEVLHLDGALDLLISDRPAIKYGGLDSQQCLIMLPISPARLFVTSFYDCGFASHQPRNVVQAANRSTVHSAVERVYGTGPHHLPLVRKRMRSADSGEALEDD